MSADLILQVLFRNRTGFFSAIAGFLLKFHIHRTCHNSGTKYDADMTLGLQTIHNKKKQDHVKNTDCLIIIGASHEMIIYFHYLVNFRPTGGLDPAEYDIVHITSSLKEL